MENLMIRKAGKRRNVLCFDHNNIFMIFIFSDDIYNRRSNTTHVNFRKAVYQSLALPYAYDEYHSIISYVKYCIKIFFACIFILLIGSLIKYAWCFNRH
jgi:hypothetical protein